MLVDPSARAFVTNGGAAEMEFNSGDYTKDAVYVTSNNEELGTVAITNGSEPVESGTEVAKGTTLTLTATAKTGAKFVKWSNGSTDNPATIVANGNPMAIVGIFAEE
jgi:hypothetical protein